MPLAASCGLSVGTVLACTRVEPAAATVVALLADCAAKAGWVMLAAALVGADWREMLDAVGLGTPFSAVGGPLLIGTSAVVVTTLATPLLVLRVEATAAGEGVAEGDSEGASDCDVALRVALGLVTAIGLVAATCAGTGSPAVVEACGAAVAWRRVAVLAAAISVDADADVLGAVAAGSIFVALGTLGAPVFRVSVAIAAGLGCAVGFSLAWARVTRVEGCSRLIELGALEGISDAFALVTCVVARSTRLACGAISVAFADADSDVACGFAA